METRKVQLEAEKKDRLAKKAAAAQPAAAESAHAPAKVEEPVVVQSAPAESNQVEDASQQPAPQPVSDNKAKEDKAATSIQRTYRGHHARREVQSMRDAKRTATAQA